MNIDEIKFKLPGAEIKAALKSDPDFKRHMQETMRGHIAQLVQETHAFFLQTVNFIRARIGQPDDGKVVLLVDSVERVRGVGNEAMKVYESVRNLFSATPNTCAFLACMWCTPCRLICRCWRRARAD